MLPNAWPTSEAASTLDQTSNRIADEQPTLPDQETRRARVARICGTVARHQSRASSRGSVATAAGMRPLPNLNRTERPYAAAALFPNLHLLVRMRDATPCSQSSAARRRRTCFGEPAIACKKLNEHRRYQVGDRFIRAICRRVACRIRIEILFQFWRYSYHQLYWSAVG